MGKDTATFAEERWGATGSDVTWSDNVRMLDQKWRHRKSRGFSPFHFFRIFFPYFFFSYYFFPYFFSSYFFSSTFSRIFFFTYFFPVFFSPYFFHVFFSRTFFLVVVVQNVGWGCSLRRPRPYNNRNLTPFLFSYIGCSLRRPRPIAIGNYPPFIFIY